MSITIQTSTSIAALIHRVQADGQWIPGADMTQAGALATRVLVLGAEIDQGPVAEECVYLAYESRIAELALEAAEICRASQSRRRLDLSSYDASCILQTGLFDAATRPDALVVVPTQPKGRQAP